MGQFVFSTGGDWDSTTLHRDGEEFFSSKLYIQLLAGRNEWGEQTGKGLQEGGEMTAYVLPQDDNPAQVAIFPGTIELYFPKYKVVVENQSPMFAIEYTRVWLDDKEVTPQVQDFFVNIDAVANEVSAYLTLFKDNWIRADEVATYKLL